MGWAGHVQRLKSQIIPRMVMAGQMFGKRPVGKPKKRCMDAVKKYSYQILNWRNLEVKAQCHITLAFHVQYFMKIFVSDSNLCIIFEIP
jgi:hypothetical protein